MMKIFLYIYTTHTEPGYSREKWKKKMLSLLIEEKLFIYSYIIMGYGSWVYGMFYF